MKKILVPTDFSATSLHALNYAMKLSESTGADIHLYHFVAIPVFSSDTPIAFPPDTELKKAGEERLSEIKKAVLKEFPGVKIETEVLAGVDFPENDILKHCTESGCDLVVLGMHGAGKMNKLIGGNAITIINNTSLPVIVVPEEAAIQSPRHIVFAFNYGENDLKNLAEIIQLCKVTSSSLTILHVNEKETDASFASDELIRLKQNAINDYNYSAIETVLLSGEPYDELNKYIETNPCDLLVISKRSKTFFDRLFTKSLTKKRLYHSKLPLMVVHSSEE